MRLSVLVAESLTLPLLPIFIFHDQIVYSDHVTLVLDNLTSCYYYNRNLHRCSQLSMASRVRALVGGRHLDLEYVYSSALLASVD